MKLLYENPFGLTKQQLVDAINSTPNTVAQEVAYLGRANYVNETKGNYYKTPVGETAYEQDPMLSQLKNGKETNSPSPNNSMEAFIDWDYVSNNKLCWDMYTGEFTSDFDFRKLLPIVILYFNNTEYQLPIRSNKPEPNSTYHLEEPLLVDYMIKLTELE